MPGPLDSRAPFWAFGLNAVVPMAGSTEMMSVRSIKANAPSAVERSLSRSVAAEPGPDSLMQADFRGPICPKSLAERLGTSRPTHFWDYRRGLVVC
jgi:hypothetical protein